MSGSETTINRLFPQPARPLRRLHYQQSEINLGQIAFGAEGEWKKRRVLTNPLPVVEMEDVCGRSMP
jgi:hypothetical protein